jgi:hypothetical protein
VLGAADEGTTVGVRQQLIDKRFRRIRETFLALRRTDPKNNPTAKDAAFLHEMHARHEAEMSRLEGAAAAKERANRALRARSTGGDTISAVRRSHLL